MNEHDCSIVKEAKFAQALQVLAHMLIATQNLGN